MILYKWNLYFNTELQNGAVCAENKLYFTDN